MQYYFGHFILIPYCVVLSRNDMKEEIKDFENLCIKCGKKYCEHAKTGRFNTVILFGHECAWDPDHEFRGFVEYLENIRL
jgi:hypothetical protein